VAEARDEGGAGIAAPAGGPVRLSFVCLGNICRSPTAAAIMAHRVAEAGLRDRIVIESAGTGGWHVGEGPDARALAEARRRGVAMEHRARRFDRRDFARLDLVLAMDRANLDDLRRLAPDEASRRKVRLLRSFDPEAPAGAEVPDPYFGGDDGFTDAVDHVDAACAGLVRSLRDGPLAAR
jgi:protein-tyrosine phosphatase